MSPQTCAVMGREVEFGGRDGIPGGDGEVHLLGELASVELDTEGFVDGGCGR